MLVNIEKSFGNFLLALDVVGRVQAERVFTR